MARFFSGLFNNDESNVQLDSAESLGGGQEEADGFWNNPFRGVSFALPSTVALASVGGEDHEAPDEDGPFLRLSYFERISLFIVCILGTFSCYAICLLFFPILSLKPRKFSLIWTIGSILFLVSFSILNGFRNFFTHSITVQRFPFTLSFVGSIAATLVFSLLWKNSLLVILSGVTQLLCSLYYTVSYFPYGRQGLELTSGVARSQVQGWLSS